MKKQKKKGSSVKGLIFILVILGLVGVYLYWHFTKSNLCVMVSVYQNSQMLPNAEVSIGKKKALTLADGSANIFVRAEAGDTLLVTAKSGKLVSSEKVYIDEERIATEYTNADIVMDKIIYQPFFKYFPFSNMLKK